MLLRDGCGAGLAAMAGYEVFHVLPKWHLLVTRPLHSSGTTAGQAIAWLAAFGAVYNCHRYATYYLLFQLDSYRCTLSCALM